MNKKIYINNIDLIFLYLEQGLIKKHLDKLKKKRTKERKKELVFNNFNGKFCLLFEQRALFVFFFKHCVLQIM